MCGEFGLSFDGIGLELLSIGAVTLNDLIEQKESVVGSTQGLLNAKLAPSAVDAVSVQEKRKATFRGYRGAIELAAIVKAEGLSGGKLLDIGGAFGVQARFFRKNAPSVHVDILDCKPVFEPLIFTGFYSEYEPIAPYDYIWASHVLEHVPNVGDFFDKLWKDLKFGGWAAITVPPLKHDMTFAHLTLWNAGLLLTHFIRAGFDCRQARILSYDYNITVIVQKEERPSSKFGSLPIGLGRKGHYFQGDIKKMNWKTKSVDVEPLEKILPFDKAAKFLDARSAPTAFYPVVEGEVFKAAYWDKEVRQLFPIR